MNHDLHIIAWNSISRHRLPCDNHQHLRNDNTNTNTSTNTNKNTNATVRAESCSIIICTSFLGMASQGIAYPVTTISTFVMTLQVQIQARIQIQIQKKHKHIYECNSTSREQLLNYDLHIMAWNSISRHRLLCNNKHHSSLDKNQIQLQILIQIQIQTSQGIAYSVTTSIIQFCLPSIVFFPISC